ncbi:uncharacterized protein LOC122816471 [Protopterus annectens]|uniref:uncharacterized protein LOC122816471 n=1 Tax=Protopterus annectens TaxID=7888 RepID=UPI001CFC324A|nr:uncharacterized protein LOC122816471 [Protopterus annectens]
MKSVALIGIMWLLLLRSATQSIAKNTSTRRTVSTTTEKMLIINEVNADNPGIDTSEFLELYHTSRQNVSLDSFAVVFYNGNNNRAYMVVNLTGYRTNNEGFFLMGSSSVLPRPDIILPNNTIQNGPDAIAVYHGESPYLDMKVTRKGLIDALVYKSKKTDTAYGLLTSLTSWKEAFLEDPFFWADDESMERCPNLDTEWEFQVGRPSPGKNNFCNSSEVVHVPIALINEVSTALSKNFEFVELLGRPNNILDGLVLVLFDGASSKVYLSMNIKGKTTSDGFFLIGNGDNSTVDQMFPVNATYPVLRRGPFAVALYRGNASNFPSGASVTATALIDAVVYTTEGDPDKELLKILIPEDRMTFVQNESIGTSLSRCSCCTAVRNPSVFIIGPSTPRMTNDCPLKKFSLKIAVCIHIPDCSKLSWSALTDMAASLTQLFAKFCGSGITAAYIMDPTIGCNGSWARYEALLAARSSSQLNQLMEEYSRNVKSTRTVMLNNRSIALDPSCSTAYETTGSSLLPTLSTPGQKRETTKEPTQATSHSYADVLINELNADNPGSQEDLEYIELFHVKGGSFPLDGYWLVLYNGKNNEAYKVLDLKGYHTNEAGYFLVGSTMVTPKPQLILPVNTIQNGADAVALYFSKDRVYKGGMQVTTQGMVDVLVYKIRASDRADQLLQVLTPGQQMILKDTGFSLGDESLSRCNSLIPKDQRSFQVTFLTPLMENDCRSNSSSPPAPLPPGVPNFVISELKTISNADVDGFVELKGPPKGNLSGYKLLFFNEKRSGMYTEFPLQGTANGKGFFVVASNRSAVPAPDMLLPADENVLPHNGTCAVTLYYSNPRLLKGGSLLQDSVVYTIEKESNGELVRRFTHGYFSFYVKERSLEWNASVSRCSFCDMNTPVVYAFSRPTPGTDNDCSNLDFFSDLQLCLVPHECPLWLQKTSHMLYSLQQALVTNIDKWCACGFSMPYLKDFVATCNGTVLIIHGKILAKTEMQQQKIQNAFLMFVDSASFLDVTGDQVYIRRDCFELHPIQRSTDCFELHPIQHSTVKPVQLQKTGTFQGWGIALLVFGLALAGLLVAVGFFYYSKRQTGNYSSIEMTDPREAAEEF